MARSYECRQFGKTWATSGFSAVRMCGFPSRNSVLATTYSPQSSPTHDCVSVGPMRRNSRSAVCKAQPGLLGSSARKTHCRLAWGIHSETGPHTPPTLSFFGLLSRIFLIQPCCEPLFNWAYSGFCRTCCHLENTLSIYKEEVSCE